jgi:hypothetical protein
MQIKNLYLSVEAKLSVYAEGNLYIDKDEKKFSCGSAGLLFKSPTHSLDRINSVPFNNKSNNMHDKFLSNYFTDESTNYTDRFSFEFKVELM